ncbi:hypothetical protein PGTUg99_011342 [Puccinia graminis f. sp. tritici]|uniref:Uncharacterized protein n=1 Tax=Puccinia graminis f. sp. tritici TaxID=56615 RepID=A0A5B0QR27_PUCGR|nr:hypothetical protein PGTUg99_011342 [Puccinia graminis f. sp. tritici]
MEYSNVQHENPGALSQPPLVYGIHLFPQNRQIQKIVAGLCPATTTNVPQSYPENQPPAP